MSDSGQRRSSTTSSSRPGRIDLLFNNAGISLGGLGLRTGTFDSPHRLAADTLRAIERNEALSVAPRQAGAARLFARPAPGLLNRMAVRFVDRQRTADRRQPTP
ncbi:hypothetical protein MSZK_10690 [Mycobacterium sp. shizuoka-1]|nr:hypothetical protein MSZK_10690 [Mycobacterium sp. shizuoka-1]